jgi:hypothetical protein
MRSGGCFVVAMRAEGEPASGVVYGPFISPKEADAVANKLAGAEDDAVWWMTVRAERLADPAEIAAHDKAIRAAKGGLT